MGTSTAILMDGKTLAARIREELKGEVQSLRQRGVRPTLATILVGEDEASRLYISSKHRAAEEVGIETKRYELRADSGEARVARLIEELGSNPLVNGILLQLPLPHGIDSRTVVDLIPPEKDVDGLTSVNLGRLVQGRPTLVPCTPKGVMRLLQEYRIPMAGSNCAIINRSILVGRPLFHLLLAEDVTVVVCHSRTRNLASITREVDIVITAAGRRPEFTLKAEMVKEGAVVVDVGMNRIEGRLVGDSDFPSVAEKASFITPVPGGVGPMTVAMLLENTVYAAINQSKPRPAVAPAR